MMFDSYGLDPAESVASIVFLVVYFGIYLLMFAFSILSYVLSSRGAQVIAKRRGIHHSWLAWIPLGNVWLLGSISDQYQYVVKGRIRNRRKLLLILSLVIVLAVAPLYAFGLGCFGAEMDGLTDPTFAQIGTILLFVFGVILLLSAITIVYSIFLYMAYYDLFASCEPKNAVVYLLLSIFVSVTMPFLIFACRKKDGGMPARKDAQPEPQIPAPVEAPVEPAPAETVPTEEITPEAPAEEPVPEAPVSEPAPEVPAAELAPEAPAEKPAEEE